MGLGPPTPPSSPFQDPLSLLRLHFWRRPGYIACWEMACRKMSPMYITVKAGVSKCCEVQWLQNMKAEEHVHSGICDGTRFVFRP